MEASKYIKRIGYLAWAQGVIGVSCAVCAYIGVKINATPQACVNCFIAGFSLAQVFHYRYMVKRFTKDDLELDALRKRVDSFCEMEPIRETPDREIPRGAIFPMREKE